MKVESMLEIGNRIKWMEKVFFTILTTKLPMTENGKMINFGAKEPSIIKKLVHLTVPSITETGITPINIG